MENLAIINNFNQTIETIRNAQEINPTTFNEWISQLDATDKTIQTYKKQIKQFMIYLYNNNISRPTRQDIVKYRDLIMQDHKPTTTRNYLIAIKQFFTYTSDMGIYPNIAKRVKNPKISSDHKKDYFSVDQLKEILKSFDLNTTQGLRDYAIISLMATSGLRANELVSANIEDLRTLGNNQVLFILGKGRTEKNEFVKITNQVEQAIRNYLKTRKNIKASDPLFTSLSNRNTSKNISPNSLSRLVKTIFNDNGFNSNRLCCHSLRASACTINLLNGGTLEETQQLLRHKSINTTMIYNHAITRENNNSEQRITDAIFN